MLRVFPHLSSSVGYITLALVLSLSRLPYFYSSTLLDACTHSLVIRPFSYCLLSLSQKRKGFLAFAMITWVLKTEDSVLIRTFNCSHSRTNNYYFRFSFIVLQKI
jgi:hypothetical protein